MMDKLVANPYLGIGLAVVGIIATMWVYQRTKRVKKLVFDERSFELLSDRHSALHRFAASYTGIALTNLTASKVLLWNCGNDVISQADIAISDPLAIELPESVVILEAHAACVSEPTNGVSTKIKEDQKNKCEIHFDYFGGRQGCLIALLHSGTTGSPISVTGTMKGVGRPLRYHEVQFLRLGRAAKVVWTYVGGFLVVPAIEIASHEYPHLSIGTYVMIAISIALLINGFFPVQKLPTVRSGGQLDARFEDGFSAKDFSQE